MIPRPLHIHTFCTLLSHYSSSNVFSGSTRLRVIFSNQVILNYFYSLPLFSFYLYGCVYICGFSCTCVCKHTCMYMLGNMYTLVCGCQRSSSDFIPHALFTYSVLMCGCDVYVCQCVYFHTGVKTQEGQNRTLGVFLYYFLPYCFGASSPHELEAQ